MDGVNRSDENGKISNLFKSRCGKTNLSTKVEKTGQTSGAEMAFYSFGILF
ncbi:hypothetical protein Hanom_Chr05g00437131 [Helianthus anomalus]